MDINLSSGESVSMGYENGKYWILVFDEYGQSRTAHFNHVEFAQFMGNLILLRERL